MSTLHVACVVEGNYVVHSAAMLHSVLAHRGGLDLQVHYLCEPGFAAEDERRLAGMVAGMGGSISFLGIPDERLAGLPTQGFTRKATWYRIFLPELLPELDRILFLDVDVVVVDSLAPLWATDVADHYLAAVTNVFQPNHLHRPAELGMAMPQSYFNAGVMLMNLDLMRRDGCAEALHAYGVAHAEDLLFRDQDALNAVLGARRHPLHPRWNCMNAVLGFPWSAYAFGTDAIQEARRNPAIRHFEGPAGNKPWHFLCPDDMRDLYAEHRRHTPWPRFRREGVTPRNVAIRLLRGIGRRLSV